MVKQYKLMKSQKNEVFNFIEARDLEPANFSWSRRKSKIDSSQVVPILIYTGGDYYFLFDFYDDEHYCTFSPGKETFVQSVRTETWQDQLGYVTFWLDYLEREIEAPDLWAEMEKYKASVSLALPEQLLNEPISASESENIAEKISILADRIEKQFELTSEQDQFVRNKLNYLAEAAKRQRSIDWIHTSIGVFVTIAMGLTLAPEQAKELWSLFKDILGGIIHLIG